MGKPSTTTHKLVWTFRSDENDLTKLKQLLGLSQGGRTFTTPEAIGVAIRLAVKQLEQEV
jgi:hypothetical protein